MTDFGTLWLPIVVSAVAVFVISSVIHMAMPWHKSDYRRLPDQDKVMEALRPFAIPPGDYMVPRPAARDEMKTPEFAEKMRLGPVMVLTVVPNGPWPMGRSLGLWFVYLLVVSFFAAFMAFPTVATPTVTMRIFHFTAMGSFLGYAPALWQMSIWYRRAWRTTIALTFDGLIYAGITAAIFVWLWPH
jgi:hypothetical protein